MAALEHFGEETADVELLDVPVARELIMVSKSEVVGHSLRELAMCGSGCSGDGEGGSKGGGKKDRQAKKGDRDRRDRQQQEYDDIYERTLRGNR